MGSSYEGTGSGVWIGIVSMTEDDQLMVLEKGEPWLLLAVVLSHFYPLFSNLQNLLNKNDLLQKSIGILMKSL